MENNVSLILKGWPVALTTVIMITKGSHHDDTLHSVNRGRTVSSQRCQTLVRPAEPLVDLSWSLWTKWQWNTSLLNLNRLYCDFFFRRSEDFIIQEEKKSSAELSDLNTSCSGFQLQTSFKGKLHQFYTLKCVYGLGSLTLYVKTVA